MVRLSSFFAVILLTACQTGAPMPAETAAELRGCWIEFKGDEATTFRWFQDRDNPTVFAGEQIDYMPMKRKGSEDTAWRIDERYGSPRLCFADWRAKNNACWRLVFTQEDLPERGRWASILATKETLVILMSHGDGQHVLFNGVRDGCD